MYRWFWAGSTIATSGVVFMRRCCGAAGCSCAVVAGPGVTVVGNGSTASPYVIGAAGSSSVVVADTACIGLSGDGSAGAPITATQVIDPDPANQVECGPAGLRTKPVPFITSNEVVATIPSTPVTSETWTPLGLSNVQDSDVFAVPAGTSVTIPQAGVYDLSAFVAWQTVNGGDRRLDITVNGVRITEEAAQGTTSTTSMAVGIHKSLAAGDVVQVRVRQGSGVQLNAGYSYSIVKVA